MRARWPSQWRFLALFVIAPVAEVMFFRAVLRSELGAPGFNLGATWFEVLPPFAFLFTLLVMRLANSGRVPCSLRTRQTVIPTVTFLASIGAACLAFTELTTTAFVLFGLTACLSLTYSLVMWWTPLERRHVQFLYQHRRQVIFFLLGTFSIFFFPFSSSIGWFLIGQTLIGPVKWMITLFGAHPAYYYVDGILYLSHHSFSVNVGAPCAGLEGIFFFLFVFSALAMMEEKSIPLKRWAGVFVMGIIMMWILNVLRISAFYTICYHVVQRFGEVYATDLFQNLFHSHVGWVLYLIGVLVYAFWIERAHVARFSERTAA